MGDREALSFTQWVSYVFDRPVGETLSEAWYWDETADWWEGPPILRLVYLTQLFENNSVLLRPYTDAQINQGLWYLTSGAASDYFAPLLDDSLPWSTKRYLLRSIATLYEDCFLPKCSPHLSHLDEEANPLNSVCYMWWDLLPTWGQPEDLAYRELDRQILNLLAHVLTLDSVACRESALHGLGHWHTSYPGYVKSIVDDFLTAVPDLDASLHTYAQNARHGMVL